MATLACAAMGVTALMNVGLAYLLDPAVRYVFLEKRASMLIPVSAAAFLVLAIRALSFFAQATMVDTVGERVAMAAQRDMFYGLMRRDIASLDSVHSGQFLSSFLYDATLLRDAVARGVANVVMEGLSLVGYGCLMFYQDWQLATFSLVVLPAVAWAMERIGGSLRRATKRSLEETGELSTALMEALDGRRIVKAYGLEHHTVARAEARLAHRLRFLLKAVRARAATVPAADIFAGIVVSMTILFAGYQTMHGELEFPRLVSFLAAMLLAQTPVRNLSQYLPIASSAVAAANRVFAVIDEAPTIVDAANAATLCVEPAPKGGGVKFENVSFAYHPETKLPTLDRVTFEVQPGRKVALVGPSGAGKSTILGLMLRFYDVDSGSVSIDGHDVRAVTIESLRRNIALVTQEPILFDESVEENIAVGRPGASRDEIEFAARGAAAHDFIVDLPQGYATRVGEGGLRLSGGQRQRIAIARAMLRNAPILLLDEATSSLDTESERQVQDALTSLMKDRTTIVIAHRLSTVQDADCIHVLERGAVVESGTHAALLARGGLYSRLYQHDFADPHNTQSSLAVST
ncbi:MAG: ABC transporter ATP-binding protein [Alphaproteobacteria bacterium]|nr:ABC transporter ATP-binding protein [Alphaproteobacteria bacterium]